MVAPGRAHAAASNPATGSRRRPRRHPEPPTLPLDGLEAVVFDLDGVLTDTAALHEQAWADTFRQAFAEFGPERGVELAPFTDDDYRRLVDGRLRLDGVRSVLADRRLALDDGRPDDPPGSASAWAIANAKDARFLDLLEHQGPHPFPGSVALVWNLRQAGVPLAVVTASRHADAVLRAAGLADLFDARVDGWTAAVMHLPGKPAPDTFVEAARRLGARPARAALVEDAAAGVEAARGGGFGTIVGVDRHGAPGALVAAGAHVVVADLAELRLVGVGPAEDPWHLQEAEDDPGREGVRETLCTLGNGYVATRGARTYVVADAVHYPGTYFAGVYDRSLLRLGDQVVEREAIVNAPNWLPLDFAVAGGVALGGDPAMVASRWLRLDMRRGLLERRFVVDDGRRLTTVLERRLVSMDSPHVAAIELTLVAENWAGRLEVRSGLDGAVADAGTVEEQLLPGRHVTVVADEPGPELLHLAVRTVQSGIVLAEVARTTVVTGAGERSYASDGHSVEHTDVIEVGERARVTVEKVVGLCTSRDAAISDPSSAARAQAARAPGFADLLDAHERAWAELWQRAGVEVGDVHADVRRAINLHLFHLLQVVSPHVVGRDVGVPARGLHGEGYLGHVFWDEMFVLPTLSLRLPEIARSLLAYRTRRLDEARQAARSAGLAGAMYPWQSGSDGRDETPTMLFNPRSGHWMADRSSLQRHVGLAVAYTFWQHFQATGDVDHLATEGAPVLVEVARFFASLARFDGAIGRHRITGVMGPDEFHDGYPWTDEPGVDDNAYTNVMAAWLFARIGDLDGLLTRTGRRSVLERLGFGADEAERFDTLARTLQVPFLADGVMAQFDGYDRLEPIDLAAYRARYGNIGRLDLILEAEGDTARRYQVAKQPDVLMLLYLFSAEELRAVLGRLGYDLPAAALRRTVSYYAQRVVHGSSLSNIVHAWVASRGDRQASWRHLVDALGLDIHDSQRGTTREGVHLGAMAGTVDILTRCYTGLEARADALWLNPRLPRELDRLAFRMQYRGHVLDIRVDGRQVVVDAVRGPATPATILVQGRPYTLGPGDRLVHELTRRRDVPPAPPAASAVR